MEGKRKTAGEDFKNENTKWRRSVLGKSDFKADGGGKRSAEIKLCCVREGGEKRERKSIVRERERERERRERERERV